MPIRESVRRLLQGLTASDARSLENNLVDVYLVLDQSQRILEARRIALDEGDRTALDSELPRGWAERYPEQIHDEFSKLLPAEYVDLVLADEEIDALVAALLPRLRYPPEISSRAATALGPSGRWVAVPGLTTLIQQFAGTDGRVASSAIRSVARILTQTTTGEVLNTGRRKLVEDALAALRQARVVGVVDALWNVPQAAEQALDSLALHLDEA